MTKPKIKTVDDLMNNLNTKRMKERGAELQRLYGKRYLEYRKQYHLAGHFKYEPDFPLYIMPEPTYSCNLSCRLCIHGYPELRRKYALKTHCMPWRMYERIVLEGEEHNCPAISTHNNDEPLLIKDLAKRIAFARRHGFMDVIMTTNGTLFTSDRIKEVIDAGITRILFSIDALTEETYKKIRVGGNLAKVLWALEHAISYRESSGLKLPIIRVSFVVNHLNQHEIKPFIDKFIGIVDYIDIQPLLVLKSYSDSLISSMSRRVQDFRCNGPWRRIVVRGNGDVLPCENFLGAGIVMGNVYKNTLYEIYNSTPMKDIRNDGKLGSYKHHACVECSQNIYSINSSSEIY